MNPQITTSSEQRCIYPSSSVSSSSSSSNYSNTNYSPTASPIWSSYNYNEIPAPPPPPPLDITKPPRKARSQSRSRGIVSPTTKSPSPESPISISPGSQSSSGSSNRFRPVPEAPKAPAAYNTYHAPYAPQAPEAPYALEASQASQASQAPESAYASQAPDASQAQPKRPSHTPPVPERCISSKSRMIQTPDSAVNLRIPTSATSLPNPRSPASPRSPTNPRSPASPRSPTNTHSRAPSSSQPKTPRYPIDKGNIKGISHTLIFPCRTDSLHPALRESYRNNWQVYSHDRIPRDVSPLSPMSGFPTWLSASAPPSAPPSAPLPAPPSSPLPAPPHPHHHTTPLRKPSTNLHDLWKTTEGASSKPTIFSLSIHNCHSSLYFGTRNVPLYTFTGQTLLRENPGTGSGKKKKVCDVVVGRGGDVRIGRWGMLQDGEGRWELRITGGKGAAGERENMRNNTPSPQTAHTGQQPLFVSLRDRIARVVNLDKQVLVELDTGRRLLRIDTRIPGVAGSDVIDTSVAAVIAMVVLEGRKETLKRAGSCSGSGVGWTWKGNARRKRYSGDEMLIREGAGWCWYFGPLKEACMVVWFLVMLGWEIGKAVVESCRPIKDRRREDTRYEDVYRRKRW